MNNTQYTDATAIKVALRNIENSRSKLVTRDFDEDDLDRIYVELDDDDGLDEYTGILYTSAPAVTIDGDGTGAAAVSVITEGIVTAVNVTVPGAGYTEANILFSGGEGAGAAAHALIGGSADSITAIVVDNVSLQARLYAKKLDLEADFTAL